MTNRRHAQGLAAFEQISLSAHKLLGCLVKFSLTGGRFDADPDPGV
jgi:hypothetical protein